MKSEMDIMNMDERQRFSWYRANRVTLMIVGIVWLGMIAYEISNRSTPWFLIIMVPVFGLLRFCIYKFFMHRG